MLINFIISMLFYLHKVVEAYVLCANYFNIIKKICYNFIIGYIYHKRTIYRSLYLMIFITGGWKLRVYWTRLKRSIEKMLFKKRSIKKTRIITIINIILILVSLFTYGKFNFVIGILFFNLIINIHRDRKSVV